MSKYRGGDCIEVRQLIHRLWATVELRPQTRHPSPPRLRRRRRASDGRRRVVLATPVRQRTDRPTPPPRPSRSTDRRQVERQTHCRTCERVDAVVKPGALMPETRPRIALTKQTGCVDCAGAAPCLRRLCRPVTYRSCRPHCMETSLAVAARCPVSRGSNATDSQNN